MKNTIRIVSKFVLVIAFLNIFAFSIRHVQKGGTKLGIFTNALKKFSEFPILVIDVFQEFKSSGRYLNIDTSFQTLNQLEYDVFAVNAHYVSSKWIISLINLKNDSIIFRWHLNKYKFLNTTDFIFSHAQPWEPILLENKSLIMQNTGSSNLFRLNRHSNVIWHNTEHIFHHSINLDKKGNIWACTRKIIELSQNKNVKYNDDYITNIDVENGNTLYDKSIKEILINNELGYLVYGLTNQNEHNTELDPFHLNDIQPVFEDGPYWKSGDLFISLRNRSAILLYRPSTNKILRVIQGPFLNQHDVDIQSDSTITLFDNNRSDIIPATNSKSQTNAEFVKLQSNRYPTLNKSNRVLLYNFKDSTFSPIYPDQFITNKIFTMTAGLHHILSNGDMFVESQNEGKVYILNENKVLLKKYFNPIKDKQVEFPQWVRIYEKINF